LGNTHEEPLTRLMASHIHSYRDLPVYAYQMQTKFRNELRAKSGIMRTREFIMKDLYSFCKNEQEHQKFYTAAKNAYIKIFERVGIGDITYVTAASGGSFSKYSHEFQTITEAGEDIIYINNETREAINEEIINDPEVGYQEEKFTKAKAVEVGNIFTLGTKYSEVLGLLYQDEHGNKQPVFMGSYGIGPARLMGTIAEIFADEKGLVWPASVAPFAVHLIGLPEGEAKANELYDDLQNKGIQVLYDDRAETSAGEKFADADLLGIPWRVVVSAKTIAQDSCEIKQRSAQDVTLVKTQELYEYLTTNSFSAGS